MKKLRKAYIDKGELGNFLVMFAKEWGVTTLQANVNDEDRRLGDYVVYFECDDDALKLLNLHIANTGLGKLWYKTP